VSKPVFLLVLGLVGAFVLANGASHSTPGRLDYVPPPPIFDTTDKASQFLQMSRFRVQNPRFRRSRKYIWTDNFTYKVGDKITLWIERVAVRELLFSAISPIQSIQDNVWMLLIKRGDKVVTFKTLLPRLEKHEWLPSKPEIPVWRLHGRRLVSPRTYEVPPGVIIEDEVRMSPGDSFVRRIPDLIKLFAIKRTPDGRVWVKCARVASRAPLGYKEIWLPIDGRYKVQWGCSNIIEFEIRQ